MFCILVSVVKWMLSSRIFKFFILQSWSWSLLLIFLLIEMIIITTYVTSLSLIQTNTFLLLNCGKKLVNLEKILMTANGFTYWCQLLKLDHIGCLTNPSIVLHTLFTLLSWYIGVYVTWFLVFYCVNRQSNIFERLKSKLLFFKVILLYLIVYVDVV